MKKVLSRSGRGDPKRELNAEKIFCFIYVGVVKMKLKEDLRNVTTSQKNMAVALSLTPQRITQLIKEKIIIRDEDSGGVYVLESLRNYYQSRTGGETELNYWEEKAKHEKVKREIAELKYRKLEGSVYEATTVEKVIIEQLVMLRTRLLGMGAKMSGQLEGKSASEIDEIIEREVEETLKEISGLKKEVMKVEEL